MTRDEYRAKCTEAIAIATWGPIEAKYRMKDALRILDSLHGIARVLWPEATEEMNKEFYRDYASRAPNEMIFHILKVGDLTNPQEGKP